jgi:hypothetical protein
MAIFIIRTFSREKALGFSHGGLQQKVTSGQPAIENHNSWRIVAWGLNFREISQILKND